MVLLSIKSLSFGLSFILLGFYLIYDFKKNKDANLYSRVRNLCGGIASFIMGLLELFEKIPPLF
jgi:uncharacterized membrane protein YfcA